jgi:glycerate dehydrogenase
MKIIVLDGFTVNPGDNPWTPLERYGEVVVFDRSTAGEVLERAPDGDILLTNKAVISGRIIERLPKLKLICVLATGYDVVDVSAAQRRGILVANVPSYGTDTVAQFVLAMMLELCLHIGDHAQSVKDGRWLTSRDWTYQISPLIELNEKILGIVGYGRIGRRVAELARTFGMQVLYSTRSPELDSSENRSVERLFAEADFISLHCGLSAQNVGMVNKRLLGLAKPSAFLINTARGGLIDEYALAEALNSGRLAGAALDVLTTEPPRSNNPLLMASNCIITPHIAWASLAARQRIMQTTTNSIEAFLRGRPINLVC